MRRAITAALVLAFLVTAPVAHADRWGDDLQARNVWVCETLMADGMPMRVHRLLAVRMVLGEKEGYSPEQAVEAMDQAVTDTCPGAGYSYTIAVTYYSMAPPESREIWDAKAALLVDDL